MGACQELPPSFPLKVIIEAMSIIMTNNYFGFCDMFFLQFHGIAMRTSAAVMWTTLYYAYHEEHCLLPQHGEHLLYYRRFFGNMMLV